MITEIDESKTLTKHISCGCKCRFDGKNVIQINGGTIINVDWNINNVITPKRLCLDSCYM